MEDTLSFFKFYDQDELNYVINRPDIANADLKLGKHDRYPVEKGSFLVADRWDVVFRYAHCMKKFLEIFPECNNGFVDFANQGKFAWFIDIDSLEFYTQQELIPNGFEDVSTVKHQGLDYDDLVELLREAQEGDTNRPLIVLFVKETWAAQIKYFTRSTFISLLLGFHTARFSYTTRSA